MIKPRIYLAQIAYNLNAMPRFLIELGIIFFIYLSVNTESALVSSIILLRVLPHLLAFIRFLISSASVWYSVKMVYFGNRI